MIARAPSLGIILMIAGCGPSAHPATPPGPGTAEILPPADAATAAGDPATPPPVDHDPPPSPARVWLTATKVDWPPDRSTARFVGIGGGAADSAAYAISGDGSTPAGAARATTGLDEAVRWRDGVMEPLAVPGRTEETRARAWTLSFDGRVIAGSTDVSATHTTPMIWREGDPPHPLPFLEGTSAGEVYGLSKDGTIAIGCGGDTCKIPVRWTGDHAVAIDGPRPFMVGEHPVTTDGQIIAGTTGEGRAARVENTSVILKDPGSRAYGISDDGKILVGSLGAKAVMWNGRKPKSLGMLPGHTQCAARAVSADGGRVVGNCATDNGTTTAWVWDAKNGMRSIADALAAAKVSTVGWSLDEVHDICSYGVTMVGNGKGPDAQREAWMAILPRW